MKKVIMVLGVLVFVNVLMVIDVKVFVKSCVVCYGVKFEKKVLGKSKIVNMMSEVEIEKDFMDFKSGVNKNFIMSV